MRDVTPAVSERMRRQRTRNTRPEMALRSALHRMGMRFRLHRSPVRDVRRSADLVFPRARLAVFVDGCYWHGCPDHATWPRTNADFWEAKILSNRARDRHTDEVLALNGWRVLRVWEHEDPDDAATRVAAALRTLSRV